MLLGFLALFAVAPVICSCLLSLVYSLYLFMAYEESGVHHAQEVSAVSEGMLLNLR